MVLRDLVAGDTGAGEMALDWVYNPFRRVYRAG